MINWAPIFVRHTLIHNARTLAVAHGLTTSDSGKQTQGL
jgi:hypothetical protein